MDSTILRVTFDSREYGSRDDFEEFLDTTVRDLSAHDVESMVRLRGEAPPGTKSSLGASTGELVLTVLSNQDFLGLILQLLVRKADRHAATVRVEIDGDKLEIVGASAADRARIIDAWVARHSRNQS